MTYVKRFGHIRAAVVNDDFLRTGRFFHRMLRILRHVLQIF